MTPPLLFPHPHHFIGDNRRREQPYFYSSPEETQHVDVLEETRERLERLQQENDKIERRIHLSLSKNCENVIEMS